MILNTGQRRSSATVVRTMNGRKEYMYPIPDAAHAKAAMARINQAKPPLTQAERAKVMARVKQVLGRKAG